MFHEKRGNCHCWLSRNREPLIVCGGDWPLSFVTLACFVLGGLFFSVEMAPHVREELQYAGYSCLGLLYLILAVASFRNPGIEYSSLRGEWIDSDRGLEIDYCGMCGVHRDRKSRHCYRCAVCVRQYDHHNYLMGNCVGANNLWCFRLAYLQAIVCFVYLVVWAACYEPNDLSMDSN